MLPLLLHLHLIGRWFHGSFPLATGLVALSTALFPPTKSVVLLSGRGEHFSFLGRIIVIFVVLGIVRLCCVWSDLERKKGRNGPVQMISELDPIS